MQTTIHCPNCKEATLIVGLFGIVHLAKDTLQGEYETECPVCGRVFGSVIFRPEPIAVTAYCSQSKS
jgi:hypothetical protein